MTRTLLVALAAASGLQAASLVSFSREGSSVFLRLSDGNAQIDWLSESSFRYSRHWDEGAIRRPGVNSVSITISETPESLKVATTEVMMTIAKNGVLVSATDSDGAAIMADASEAERQDGSITWERTAAPRARYFGLGPREDSTIELRGSRMAALKPFLLSSEGYGELHAAPGNYSFDLGRAKPDRYRIEAHGANRIDYYFFYGPGPKEILEQSLSLDGPVARMTPGLFDLIRPPDLPAAASVVNKPALADAIHSLVNGSLSRVLLPALALDAYQSAPEVLRKRAVQLGSVSPLVTGSRADAMRGTIRGDLTIYLETYLQEARDRGIPLLRALPLQFSKDPEAAKISDQFMLGDELLVAPMYDTENTRRVYLPMGIWTRLSNNQVYQGRQTITVEAGADELPLFSRNGMIVPLGSNPMKLHYFPRLGAEFFLFEDDLGESSQVHAGPAGDYMRLEIESKKDREYEWVVHHSERPRRITVGDAEYVRVERQEQLRTGAWFYDSRNRNLHVRAMGPAHADVIINISF